MEHPSTLSAATAKGHCGCAAKVSFARDGQGPRAGMKEAHRRGVKFRRKAKLSPAKIGNAGKAIEHGERVDDVAAF